MANTRVAKWNTVFLFLVLATTAHAGDCHLRFIDLLRHVSAKQAIDEDGLAALVSAGRPINPITDDAKVGEIPRHVYREAFASLLDMTKGEWQTVRDEASRIITSRRTDERRADNAREETRMTFVVRAREKAIAKEAVQFMSGHGHPHHVFVARDGATYVRYYATMPQLLQTKHQVVRIAPTGERTHVEIPPGLASPLFEMANGRVVLPVYLGGALTLRDARTGDEIARYEGKMTSGMAKILPYDLQSPTPSLVVGFYDAAYRITPNSKRIKKIAIPKGRTSYFDGPFAVTHDKSIAPHEVIVTDLTTGEEVLRRKLPRTTLRLNATDWKQRIAFHRSDDGTIDVAVREDEKIFFVSSASRTHSETFRQLEHDFLGFARVRGGDLIFLPERNWRAPQPVWNLTAGTKKTIAPVSEGAQIMTAGDGTPLLVQASPRGFGGNDPHITATELTTLDSIKLDNTLGVTLIESLYLRSDGGVGMLYHDGQTLSLGQVYGRPE